MPTINPSLIPTKNPGTLFDSFVNDTSLDIRWIQPTEPVMSEIANRPTVDVAVRQLVLAKAVDSLQFRLGHQSLYPYRVTPKVVSGTEVVDIPIELIWDFHVSLPAKWENLRLAKIKRMSGVNSSTSGYTGTLRLIFTANIENATTELAVFYADYVMDSTLTYQMSRITVATSAEESSVINPGELTTVSGFVIFRSLSQDLQTTLDFYDVVAPPASSVGTDADLDGFFDSPAVYHLQDNVAGGVNVTEDFSTSVISHGTGLLTASAWNAIPELDSNVQSWLESINYPFDSSANRRSTDNIEIPLALFKEFNITAPAGDGPLADTSGLLFPVWINRVERIGTGNSQLRFHFATYNTTETQTGGAPSLDAVEFASLDLERSNVENDVIDIVPDANLKLSTSADFGQGFGVGHVVLSAVWDGSTTTIDDFFDAFAGIISTPADTDYTASSTRISSFGISRASKHIPTVGQSRALLGSTARRDTAIHPSQDNRYVCEQDVGLGNQVDLESESGVTPHVAIDRYGYSGGLVRKCVKLVVDGTALGSSDTVYDTEILPRLRILLGRDPVFGDVWMNGVRFLTYDGQVWIG